MSSYGTIGITEYPQCKGFSIEWILLVIIATFIQSKVFWLGIGIILFEIIYLKINSTILFWGRMMCNRSQFKSSMDCLCAMINWIFCFVLFCKYIKLIFTIISVHFLLGKQISLTLTHINNNKKYYKFMH